MLRAVLQVGARALLALLCAGACNPSPSTSEPARRSAEASTARAVPASRLEVIEITTGGASKEAKLPLVIAMHGLGDRPESFATLFAGLPVRARILLPRAPDAWGEGFSWFPFRAGASDDERARGIAIASERVAAELPRWLESRPTSGKPIVTGFSQGGMLSFALAVRHSSELAAALPIGGVLPEPLWPALDAAKPSVRIIALHGRDDELVPPGPTRSGIDALVARGFDARLESFPGVGHRIPAEVRARYFELLAAEVTRAGESG